MVEISLSGSGEGPGWETSRPTLQSTFAPAPRSAPPGAPSAPAGSHGSSRAPSAARLLGLDTRCWTGERRAGGGGAAGTAVAQAGREDIADYALEWAVRTLWRARRAHHRRSGPRRDDMPSPAKACRHGLLRRPWPLPPAAPVSSRDGLAAARCVESAPGRGQRGHGKCSREESRPRAGDVANANPHGMRRPNAPHSKEAMTAMTRG